METVTEKLGNKLKALEAEIEQGWMLAGEKPGSDPAVKAVLSKENQAYGMRIRLERLQNKGE